MTPANFTATASTTINATPAQLWEALTKPTLIKQYFFGVDVITDWQVGSPIVYKGVWDGKPFEEKGVVLKVEPEHVLESSYWSPSSGLPDKPEHYQKVTYTLTPTTAGTMLTVTQENNPTPDSAEHSEQNWQTVLENMKKMIEKH